jgi:chitodextrinase
MTGFCLGTGDTVSGSGSGAMTWATPVNASIVPDTDLAYNLGSASKRINVGFIDSIKDGSNLLSASFGARILYANNGSSASLDWSDPTQIVLKTNIVPDTDNTKSIGSVSARIATLFVAQIGDTTNALSISSAGTFSIHGTGSLNVVCDSASIRLATNLGRGVTLYGSDADTASPLIFNDATNAKYVKISAVHTLTNSYAMQWPLDQGGANTVMFNDGSGQLDWSTVNSLVTGASGTFTTVDLKTVTVSNGRVTSIV